MYNLAIVGSSFISEDLIKTLEQFDQINVLCLYSRTEKKGKEFIKENNIKKLYTNYKHMLKDKEVDIVYIASPNSCHYEQALKAIKYNKHVLIEKPIALNAKQLNRLYDEAQKRNVVIMEAIVNIFYNTFLQLENMLKEIGKISFVEFNLQQQTRHFSKYKNEEKINVFSKKMGGGALRDLGPYSLYPLVYLFGKPNNVNYFSIKNKEAIDETTNLICLYNTFNAIINVSKVITDIRENIICGEDGYIIIDHINYMKKVSLYNNQGILIKEVSAEYEDRMYGEVKYFLNLINKKEQIDVNFKKNSIIVCDLISQNYK